MVMIRQHVVIGIYLLGMAKICHTAQEHLHGNRDWDDIYATTATQAAPAASTIDGAGVGTLTEMSIDGLDADGDHDGLLSDEAADAGTLGDLGHVAAASPAMPEIDTSTTIKKITIRFNEEVFGNLIRGKRFNQGIIYNALKKVAENYHGVSKVTAKGDQKTIHSINSRWRKFELTFNPPLDSIKSEDCGKSVARVLSNYGFIIQKIERPDGKRFVVVCSANQDLTAQINNANSPLRRILNQWVERNRSSLSSLTDTAISRGKTVKGIRYDLVYVFAFSGPTAKADSSKTQIEIEQLLQYAKRS